MVEGWSFMRFRLRHELCMLFGAEGPFSRWFKAGNTHFMLAVWNLCRSTSMIYMKKLAASFFSIDPSNRAGGSYNSICNLALKARLLSYSAIVSATQLQRVRPEGCHRIHELKAHFIMMILHTTKIWLVSWISALLLDRHVVVMMELHWWDKWAQMELLVYGSNQIFAKISRRPWWVQFDWMWRCSFIACDIRV